MESGELLQFTMRRYVKARRMLPARRLHALGHNVFGCLMEPIEHERLLAGLWGSQVVGHGLGGTGRGYVLSAENTSASRQACSR